MLAEIVRTPALWRLLAASFFAAALLLLHVSLARAAVRAFGLAQRAFAEGRRATLPSITAAWGAWLVPGLGAALAWLRGERASALAYLVLAGAWAAMRPWLG